MLVSFLELNILLIINSNIKNMQNEYNRTSLAADEIFKEKYNFAHATPVMKQYLEIKSKNLQYMLLFRMGDFYELFYEDAITAARVLAIALTKRGKTAGDEIPMCGVPFHALENYMNKLINEGFKIAICDQTETPEEAKKEEEVRRL